jgi:RimJ/RimL family protein N-acetyltransferase
VVGLGAVLTVAEAREVCRSAHAALARGASALLLDGSHVTAIDAVGLATLLEVHRRAARLGIECAVLPSAELARDAVHAKLVEEIQFLGAPRFRVSRPASTAVRPASAVVARAGRVVLRQPTAADAVHFRLWALDPVVEQMVGSDLLYRHRHLPAGDPVLVASLTCDPCAVTTLVEAAAEPHRPRGFVRLYDVDLVSGFGFVETVVAEPAAASRGLGVEAARLLLAFAQDALRLRRVEAKVYAYNVPSINALRRNGFRQEGVLRQARMYDGEPWDIFVFSILAEEMTAERARDGLSDFSLFREEALE